MRLKPALSYRKELALWIYNAPTTLSKCEFPRTVREMFMQAQHKSTHILPQAWISHNHISISHIFRHGQIHTHTHTFTHTRQTLSRNLFQLSTLESEGDRIGLPHQKQSGTVREAMTVSLGYRHKKTSEIKEASQLGS